MSYLSTRLSVSGFGVIRSTALQDVVSEDAIGSRAGENRGTHTKSCTVAQGFHQGRRPAL